KVLNMLRNREYITNIEIIEKLNVTCPHGYIRNLRKHFGADFVLDETVNKKTKEMYNGKMHTVTTNYKKYFLNKFEY
ncbi:MAG: helix-turn-helix domain-containing protein, partial [bacterium]|nr:helix-turn-helix domain-containing protein [bacterium]